MNQAAKKEGGKGASMSRRTHRRKERGFLWGGGKGEESFVGEIKKGKRSSSHHAADRPVGCFTETKEAERGSPPTWRGEKKKKKRGRVTRTRNTANSLQKRLSSF